MISFLLMIATLSAAQPLSAMFSADDYPERAMRENEHGTTFVQFLIDPAGAVDKCFVIQSSEYPDLDHQTCAVVRRRVKFTPAKDEDGRNVFGLFRIPVTWAINQAPKIAVYPEFDLTINRGPRGVHLPLTTNVSYLITSAGTVAQCQDPDPHAPQELTDVACNVIKATPVETIHDHNGLPVTVIDSVRVRFSVKA